MMDITTTMTATATSTVSSLHVNSIGLCTQNTTTTTTTTTTTISSLQVNSISLYPQNITTTTMITTTTTTVSPLQVNSIGLCYQNTTTAINKTTGKKNIRKNVVSQGSLNWNYITSVNKKIEDLKKKGFLNTTKMNFIVGITGAGKSTLLNYIAGVTLSVNDGKLDVSKTTQISHQAKIGHESVSETDIPNGFILNNICYLDCPGEFDNKDEKQNLINSSLKEYCGKDVKEVKITLVVEQPALETSRGAGLRAILDNLGKFVGDWESISKNGSVSMVITKAERCPSIREKIIKKLKAIMNSERKVDIKSLLRDTIERKAIAIFCKAQNVEEERSQKLKRLEQAKKMYGCGLEKSMITHFLGEGFNLSAVEVNQEIQRISNSSVENQEVCYKPFEDGEICFDRNHILQILENGKFKIVKGEVFKKNLSDTIQIRIDSICRDLVKLINEELHIIVVPSAMRLLYNNNHTDLYLEELCRSIHECGEISEFVNICGGKESEDLKSLKEHLKFFSSFKGNNEDFGYGKIVEQAKRICSDLRALSTHLKSIQQLLEHHTEVIKRTGKVAEAKASSSKKNLFIGTVCATTAAIGVCASGGVPIVAGLSAATLAGESIVVGGAGLSAYIVGTGGFFLSRSSMKRALNEAEALRNMSKKRLDALDLEKKKVKQDETSNEKEIKKINERSLMYAVKIDPDVIQEAWNNCGRGQQKFSQVEGEVYFKNEKNIKCNFNIDAHCFGRGRNNSISGTMLHMASFYGQDEMVYTLLIAKAHIMVDVEGKTPCMLAAEKNNETVLAMFKNHSLNDFNRELLLAAEKGFGKVITSLLSAGADEKYRDEEKKWNALLWAVYQEEEEAVKACLDSGKFDVNEVCENSKQSALHIAARYNKGSTIVEMFLDRGADVRLEDNAGYTAFLLAVKSNPWSGGIPQKIRDKMLMKRNVNFFEMTLFSAIENNVEGVVSLLCDKDPKCIDKRCFKCPDGFNQTKSTESAYYTPLTRACQLGNGKLVEELLKAGADRNLKVHIKGTNLIGDGAWWSPYEIAHKLGLTEILYLFEKYPQKNIKSVNKP